MNPARIACIALALALALCACATSAERLQYKQEELAIYEKHAGAPVDHIRSFRLLGWQPAGDTSILLEARLNEWYWIEVDPPCFDLPYAQKIGFKMTMNTLQSRFDDLLVGPEQCRIRSIRPIDYRAAREELAALRRR